ncbi:MAG: PAS domain-containing sensor histidine kinase [Planctomycetota bacterium]|jgi:PAS domain S-box-containing protein|nr:PAS domain-containing sensor histidine kinase [Planctomycetota bacterium]
MNETSQSSRKTDKTTKNKTLNSKPVGESEDGSTESLLNILSLQRRIFNLKNIPNRGEMFGTLQSLLEEIIPFKHFSLRCRNASGEFTVIREDLPENPDLNPSMLDWVMKRQELSLLPLSQPDQDNVQDSLLFLPMGQDHVIMIWLDQSPESFTREKEASLSLVSREIASVLDIQRYHLKLEKTRETISDILESVPMGVFSIDATGIIRMMNAAAEKDLGVNRLAASSQPYNQILSPEITAHLDQRLGENSTSESEVELPPREGEVDGRYLGITISPLRIDDDSTAIGRVVICRDLKLSREVKKLRQLDSMKSDFLSLASHELRTPLTSIMAYSETLLMSAEASGDTIPPEWCEYLDIIINEGKRLCRIIDDAIDLTKLEAGMASYDFGPNEPNDIIENVVMSLMSQLEAKNLSLGLELADDIGLCRLCLVHFTKAIHNILQNAITFTEPGGSIVIRSYRSDPMPDTSVPSLIIEVEDTGIGISPEEVEKVFAKFEIGGAVKNHTSGSGLGLTICRQIITDHSGKIWIESKPGIGTKVIIQVPIFVAEEPVDDQ